MITKLDSKIINFTHIIHFADCHVFLRKRHQEYREVFERFYANVDKSPETTLICNLGDTFNNKVDLSPESVDMVSNFLYNLAERRETILVAGNHDLLVRNKNRLDSLSPIVDTLSHPKLHYLKQSGLYGIGNILFNNMSVFDPPEKYIKAIEIPDFYKNQYQHIIALFHGPVDGAVTDTGYVMPNPIIMPQLFDWHDIVLLGDIHKRQNIQVEKVEEHKPCIHFAGSMIQQNHGEPLRGHGYTLWNLNDYSYQYIDLPNEYGYFTVELHGSEIITDLSDLPKKTYLRLKCLDCIPSEVKNAEAKISQLTEIAETPSRIRIDSEKVKKAKEAEVCRNVRVAEINDLDYQGNLITEFLQRKLNIEDKTKIDKILLFNREINRDVKKDEFPKNLKWTPVRFEWDNMFSYGEDNVIDFENMRGIYGVFGPNAVGKSAIFDALCFCLFDKWSRGFKALAARNVAKENFRCKFEFKIGNIHYFIEKIGQGTRAGNVRVGVNFWRVVNGVYEDLTDIMRRKTNEVIEDYIGTFEDFVMTTFSIQTVTKNNISFIDLGNTERKEKLTQIIGLNLFDRLYEEAYARNKDLAARLKPHKDRNYLKELNEAKTALAVTTSAIVQCNFEITNYSAEIKNINDQILAETVKLIKLDNDVPSEITSLNTKYNAHKIQLTELENKIQSDKSTFEVYRTTLSNLEDQISDIKVEDINENYKKFQETRIAYEKAKREYDLYQVGVNHKLAKLDRLSQYEYDPKCSFCLKNMASVIKDTKETEKELTADQIKIQKDTAQITILNQEQEKYAGAENIYKNYSNLLTQRSVAKDSFSTLQTKILLAEKDVEKLKQTIKEIERKIDLYHKNEASVDNNQRINMAILQLKNTLNTRESSLNARNKRLLELTGQQEVFRQKIEMLDALVNDQMEIERKQELYGYYCQAVGSNGIPYQVICDIIPHITEEINVILSQTSDFTIEIEADEKNIIPYVNYETKGRWSIESLSGYERFAASVAIRVALSNITNLQRTNFLIIDEGWAALDSHNIQGVSALFSYLKTHYDFVFVVSHLDVIRDFVDKQIEIKQEGNFSKVVFE